MKYEGLYFPLTSIIAINSFWACSLTFNLMFFTRLYSFRLAESLITRGLAHISVSQIYTTCGLHPPFARQQKTDVGSLAI